jgi:hypothetical protein
MAGRILAVAVALATVAPASASTINVLWYTGGVEAFGNSSGVASYQTGINNLAASAPSFTVGNSWNVTYWSSGPMPAGSYNVLVTASSEGGWSSYPNYTPLITAAPAHGDRVMVTGQDADWHYLNYPGPTAFNGPKGFLIDAINWAGSGTGLGEVFLSPGNSVLGALLTPAEFLALGADFGTTNNVVIPPSEASFPINEGLTTAGLSNWSTSAHDVWHGSDTAVWNGINTDGLDDQYVTLVSAATADLPTTSTPEPATVTMLGMGVASLFGYGWRKRKQAA